MLTPRSDEQRPDIAVVLIAEETLLDYESRSPINGRLLAELVRAIDAANPKVIALDFILDRRTKDTSAFTAAIRGAKHPVVLGAVDARMHQLPKESLAIQEERLKAAGRPVGHLLFAYKNGRVIAGDATVRLIADDFPQPESRRSFSAEIARAIGVVHKPPSKVISWLLPPRDTALPLFATLVVPRHKLEDIKPALAGIVPESWRNSLEGRVVIVGAQMVDRDRHPTPLSVIDGARVPGVMIHAQVVAQQLDAAAGRNRDIRDPGYLAEFIIVGLVALGCFYLGRAFRLGNYEKQFQLLGLLLIGLVSLAAFWLWRVNFPSGPITFAWLIAAIAGHYSHMAFRRLGME